MWQDILGVYQSHPWAFWAPVTFLAIVLYLNERFVREPKVIIKRRGPFLRTPRLHFEVVNLDPGKVAEFTANNSNFLSPSQCWEAIHQLSANSFEVTKTFKDVLARAASSRPGKVHLFRIATVE